MRDLMTQTSSVLQTTPTCQHQYLETKNAWWNNLSCKKLNQFNQENLDLKLKQLLSTRQYFWSSTSGYQQKSVGRWRRGRLLLTAKFAGAINAATPATTTQSAGSGHTGLDTPVSKRTSTGYVLRMCNPPCSSLPSVTPVKCQTLLQPWRRGAPVTKRARNPQQPLRTTVFPQVNLQEVDKPNGRSYYLYWPLLFKLMLPPQPSIKEKENFTPSLKKSV